MKNKTVRIDLVKMLLFILKRFWLLAVCAVIGAAYMYRGVSRQPDTYTASGTMYVYNANPNLVNYGYTNSADLTSAIMLVETYRVVVNSNRVLDAVVERLTEYPNITSRYIAGTLSMASVSETGVVRVSCRTDEPQKSADICNAVLNIAPNEIKRVVGAGDVVIIDYATTPLRPDARSFVSRIMTGALMGVGAAAVLLAVIFLLSQRVEKPGELSENYTPPVLSSIRRSRRDSTDPSTYTLNEESPMDQIEAYAKLRMNLFYTLVNKERHAVLITSPVSGEGKSTITANLALSVSMMKGKKILLVDADMRCGSQRQIFRYDGSRPGLSNVLVGDVTWQEALMHTQSEQLDLLPAGSPPPNPAELLDSPGMHRILEEMTRAYDLVLLDAPPINIVSDPLALSSQVAGSLFVVRQGYSKHGEIRRALAAAEMTGLDILGFVFFGDNPGDGAYYSRQQRNYYKSYDTRLRKGGAPAAPDGERRGLFSRIFRRRGAP